MIKARRERVASASTVAGTSCSCSTLSLLTPACGADVLYARERDAAQRTVENDNDARRGEAKASYGLPLAGIVQFGNRGDGDGKAEKRDHVHH